MWHLPIDRSRIELHNTDNERRMRRRDMRGLGPQIVAMCGACIVALAILYAAIQFT